MNVDLEAREICLSPNHPLRVRHARGQRVTCTAGTLWLTVTGESNDTFLQAGESYVVPKNGLLLIESINQGRVRLGSSRLISRQPPMLLTSDVRG